MMKLGFGLGLASTTGSGAAFSPLDLAPLALYNVQDLGTLWQDEAGTTPADTAGQTVKRIDDLSGNGNHATNAAGVTLRQDDFGFWYLETTAKASALRVTISALAAWPTIAAAQWGGSGGNAYGICVSGGNNATVATRQHGGIGAHFENGVITTVLDEDLTVGHVAIVVDPLSSDVAYNGNAVTWSDPGAKPTLDRIIIGATDENAPLSGTSGFYAGAVVTRALTAGERSSLSTWMEARCPSRLLRSAAVFQVIGQSNAEGRATDTGASVFPSLAFEWGSEGAVAATHPLENHDIAQTVGKMGFQSSFADDWQTANGGYAVYIASADGATGFRTDHWNPGDSAYNLAVSEANSFFRMYGGTMTAFLWHQGEAEIGLETGFADALDAMIAQIRVDVTGASATTPFILGQIGENVASGATVRSVIADTPNRVAYTALADSNGLTMEDGPHFDEASMITFGHRYYTELATLLGAPVLDVPENTVAPSIPATADVDDVLTVTPGTWSGSGITLTYQWQRDGSDISGATGTSYTVVSADEGTDLTVLETATNADGSDVAASNACTVAVAGEADEALVTSLGGALFAGSRSVMHSDRAGTTLAVADGLVGQIDALAGSDWAAAADANRLTLRTNGTETWLETGGGSTVLVATASTGGGSGTKLTTVAAVKFKTGTGTNRHWAQVSGNTWSHWHRYLTSGRNKNEIVDGVTSLLAVSASPGIGENTWGVLTATCDTIANELKVWLDGTLIIDETATDFLDRSNTTMDIGIGASVAATLGEAGNCIAYFLAVPDVLDATERATIEALAAAEHP